MEKRLHNLTYFNSDPEHSFIHSQEAGTRADLCARIYEEAILNLTFSLFSFVFQWPWIIPFILSTSKI